MNQSLHQHKASRSNRFASISTTAGALLAVAAMPCAAYAQINNLQMLHVNDYRQTATNAYTNLGAYVQFVLLAQNASNLSTANVELPDEDTIDLETFGGGVYTGWTGTLSSQSSLMSAYPSGNYVFNWSGGSLPPANFAVNQPFANGIWPSIFPRFNAATFQGLAGMDPSQAFVVSLINPFTAHPSSETQSGGMYISTVQSSGLPGSIVYSQIGSNASALLSSRTIPANTLQPNTSYFVTWLFANAIEDDPALIGTTRVEFRVTTRLMFTTGAAQPACDSIDFNGDSLFPDDADLIDFLAVLAGGACSTGTCNDIDFNNDGLFPDDTDLVAFLAVLAGGSCA